MLKTSHAISFHYFTFAAKSRIFADMQTIVIRAISPSLFLKIKCMLFYLHGGVLWTTCISLFFTTGLLKHSKMHKLYVHHQSHHLRSNLHHQHLWCNAALYFLISMSTTKLSDKFSNPPPGTAPTCIKNPASREKHNWCCPQLSITSSLTHCH